MKTLTDNELDALLGKTSIWKPIRTSQLFHYTGGIESFDEHIDPNAYLKVRNLADIEVRPNGIELRMMHNFKRYKVGIPFTDLVSINLEDSKQLVSESDRSVMGRAVIGGLLLGPVGAIVGGITGLKKDRVATDVFVTLSIGRDKDNVERVIILSCADKNKMKAFEFFTKNLPGKFQVIK